MIIISIIILIVVIVIIIVILPMTAPVPCSAAKASAVLQIFATPPPRWLLTAAESPVRNSMFEPPTNLKHCKSCELECPRAFINLEKWENIPAGVAPGDHGAALLQK